MNAVNEKYLSKEMVKHKIFWVPNQIFVELKPRDFSVYCCLLRHSDSKDGSCFPSRRVIAKECGIDRKTVDSAIEKLSDLGLVKKISLMFLRRQLQIQRFGKQPQQQQVIFFLN